MVKLVNRAKMTTATTGTYTVSGTTLTLAIIEISKHRSNLR